MIITLPLPRSCRRDGSFHFKSIKFIYKKISALSQILGNDLLRFEPQDEGMKSQKRRKSSKECKSERLRKQHKET
jgi:hypothetical protein